MLVVLLYQTTNMQRIPDDSSIFTAEPKAIDLALDFISICETSWNNSIGNKLLDIKPTIGEYQSVVRNIRKEEVVLAGLRLGHTRVTHSYLLQGEEHPHCVGCDAPFTVRHFLLECGDFAQVRNNCFHVNNMKELFQDIHIDSIMTFLRQINLFNKI